MRLRLGLALGDREPATGVSRSHGGALFWSPALIEDLPLTHCESNDSALAIMA